MRSEGRATDSQRGIVDSGLGEAREQTGAGEVVHLLASTSQKTKLALLLAAPLLVLTIIAATAITSEVRTAQRLRRCRAGRSTLRRSTR